MQEVGDDDIFLSGDNDVVLIDGMDEDLLPEARPATLTATSDETMLALRSAFKPQGVSADPSADPLSLYLAHIRNHPLLDADMQQQLALRYREQGDKEAAQLLVLTNLRLVVKIAREYRRRWSNLLELIQEGNVGLSEAIQRYNPYRHVKFTSYAQYWIRAMILNYLMNHFQPIRIGSTRAGRKLFYNLKKARAQLQAEGVANPTPALVAEKLGVSERDVIDVSQHLDQPALSIDQNAPGYENTSIGELLPDENDNPEEIVARNEFYEKVRNTMLDFASSLNDPRDIALWNRRLIATEPVTLSELGNEYGVSKERIRQVEARLKDRFKDYINERIDGDISSYIDV
ncbi:MAG: sigma-70 family RNA polymerase sigma factor [Bradymonadia bacterium]